jgi:di/tricarboxylate transporter
MTLDQALSFGTVLGVVGLFVWGRLPYDLVALTGLLAGVLLGIVPAAQAFEGFSDDIVIIIAAALLVSEAIGKSGAIETLMRPILPHLTTTARQVPVMVAAVTVLSMISKNVGALAILMPVALQLARRTGTSPGRLLMPMSFGALLGGLVTLVGTSPNIIIARVRGELFHHPFTMFDFTPVGLAIAVLGAGFLSVGYRLLPRDRQAPPTMAEAVSLADYTAEARPAPRSPAIGRSVAELEAMAQGAVRVSAIIRERFRRFAPAPSWRLAETDAILLRGPPEEIEALVARAGLRLAAPDGADRAKPGEASVIEGVVAEASPLIGNTPRQLDLQRRHGVALLAISRSGARITQSLDSVRLRAGDVLVLRGGAAAMPDALASLRVLPLAERDIALGSRQRSWIPLLVLGVAMAAMALQILPVAIAFLAASVVLLLLRRLSMAEAYEAIEWHVVVVIAALIPLGHAVHATGGTDLLAGWLGGLAGHLPGWGALTLVLVVTMAITPFLHNAPTVLVFGPIAAGLAARLGFSADPFLMAVALGAGCDFLTPVGHQCNTLVMGPGGYRFADYPRLGLPLSCLVVLVGVPLILWVWPLRP